MTGALACAAALFLLIGVGHVPAFQLWGHCFGLLNAGVCEGLEAEFYLYPGLFFGIAFAALIPALSGRLGDWRVVAFAIVSTAANAIAVEIASMLADPIASVSGDDPHMIMTLGIIGAVSGAIGGGLLGYGAARLMRIGGWLSLAATGAVLGLLLPLVIESMTAMFVFYAVWQAGYAAMLADILWRRRTRDDDMAKA